ncbi:MAG TPA: hypothetical protein PLO63_07615 [Syntrophales bacterium]|nr:hypothetical protein [Syntrophales bacterium]
MIGLSLAVQIGRLEKNVFHGVMGSRFRTPIKIFQIFPLFHAHVAIHLLKKCLFMPGLHKRHVKGAQIEIHIPQGSARCPSSQEQTKHIAVLRFANRADGPAKDFLFRQGIDPVDFEIVVQKVGGTWNIVDCQLQRQASLPACMYGTFHSLTEIIPAAIHFCFITPGSRIHFRCSGNLRIISDLRFRDFLRNGKTNAKFIENTLHASPLPFHSLHRFDPFQHGKRKVADPSCFDTFSFRLCDSWPRNQAHLNVVVQGGPRDTGLPQDVQAADPGG